MDKKFSQTDIVYCKQHSERLINSLYYKKDCPYPSRLACIQCLKKYNTIEGFEDVLLVLNEPRVIMNNNLIPKGKFDKLNEYLNFLEQDPEEVSFQFNDKFIRSFKEEIFKQIDKLVNDIKEKLTSEIAQVRLQFNEALGCEKFRQAFRDILKVDNYHESEEWKKFEATVQDFVLQFEELKNQKLDESYTKLKQTATFFQPQLLKDFKESLSQNVVLLQRNVENMEVFSKFTSLCDKEYQFELIKRINKTNIQKPKVTLLFRGTSDGLNGQTFWEKCSNKGPTLTICKSKNGYVFGGYTPCKWIPSSGVNQKDDSKTSFLFSYTRKEIYPIVSIDHAIYGHPSYGPTFGGGHNLCISTDFQSGYSRMDAKYYSNESYKIENADTHLMGDETPQLVEMEVFLIEQ